MHTPVYLLLESPALDPTSRCVSPGLRRGEGSPHFTCWRDAAQDAVGSLPQGHIAGFLGLAPGTFFKPAFQSVKSQPIRVSGVVLPQMQVLAIGISEGTFASVSQA